MIRVEPAPEPLFIQEIRRFPDDEALRGVYADFLAETPAEPVVMFGDDWVRFGDHVLANRRAAEVTLLTWPRLEFRQLERSEIEFWLLGKEKITRSGRWSHWAVPSRIVLNVIKEAWPKVVRWHMPAAGDWSPT